MQETISYYVCPSGVAQYALDLNKDAAIGGFRDTYLGRQVVARPGEPRAAMGSAGGLMEHCELP